MKRIAALAVVASLCAAVVWIVVRAHKSPASCGAGFVAQGTRCCPPAGMHEGDRCAAAVACPLPLSMVNGACIPSRTSVLVQATHLSLGAVDWEAEGVPAREVDVRAFRIDAFEVTEGELHAAIDDGARAANDVTRDEAESFCRTRGGRLPTGDEWTAAAQGGVGRRYPWGDTGAVCRRAAWGLRDGPCAASASGPDTAGAHSDGDTPSGIHDMAGNVAEWVAADASDARGFVRGGSFRSPLATQLRTWIREKADPSARHDWVGFRCAYDER